MRMAGLRWLRLVAVGGTIAGVATAGVLIAMPHRDVTVQAVSVSPDAVAQAQAKATGRPVTVDADTTSYATTVANPNGTFTYTSYPAQQRVRKNGSWVKVDPTLQAQADGSLAPK